ncbi:MAG: nuclear transport factor 2 family protein, partial [Acidimicrobiia bacterium]
MTPADLVEIEAIKQVKYRYFRFLDLKQWDDMESLFVPEATCAYSAGAYSYEGREAIIEFFRKAMGRETFLSSHKAHHPEITLTGTATATGIWSLDDWVVDTQWELDIR